MAPAMPYTTFFLLSLALLVQCDDLINSMCLQSSGYNLLRGCARECLGYSNEVCWILGDYLTCKTPSGKYLNSCLCREDLVPKGQAYLSSCILKSCSSNTVDIGSALNLYSSYCANTGKAATPIQLSTTGNQGTATAAGTQRPVISIKTATITATLSGDALVFVESETATVTRTVSAGSSTTSTPCLLLLVLTVSICTCENGTALNAIRSR